MQKTKNYLKNIWSNLHNRYTSWSLGRKIFYIFLLFIILLIGFMILKPKDNSANITTDTVNRVDLEQTILATGQVTSNTDLDLSFFSSGIVRSIRAAVGDRVAKGQILATLDQGNELASLTQAKGAVAAAEARYQKLLDGASNEEIELAKIALENANLDYTRIISQQETLVSNAYQNLLNSTLDALPVGNSNTDVTVTISGNYNKTEEGKINILVYSSGSGARFSASGLASGDNTISTTSPQPIGDSGLYILFSTTSNISSTSWTIDIPNKKASDYLTNYNAYQSALRTQTSALGTALALINQRKAELAIKQSQAREADIGLAKADILSAQGQYQLASANYEHTVLRAPASGTITKVDIKIGELAQAQKNIMVIQDVNNIYLEANINEANITSVKIDAPIDITFDSFGSEQHYSGSIINIEPSSTIISGVVNYKITASIFNAPELRPGMTANMTILVGEKKGVLAIPSRAVIKDKIGTKTVRVITNSKTKDYKEVIVNTGMEGDGGLVEITSGLSESEEIVVMIKK